MKNVVLIDDHEIIRSGIKVILKDKWQVAGSAATLKEAKIIFKSLTDIPDLIILDLQLEKEWGLDIIGDKSFEKDKFPPVLVYSVYDDYAHVNAAIRSGAMGYVCKSQSSTELLAAMEDVSSGKTNFPKEMLQQIAITTDKILKLNKREQKIFNMVQLGKNNKVIGFGVVSCGGGDDDGGNTGGQTGGGGSGPNTPLPNNLKNTKWKNGDGYGIEFLETTFRKYGQWGAGDMTCFSAKENGKITGKIGTSNVWQYMDEETICTSYTITGNTIVFVGSDTKSWDKLLEGTWTKEGSGTGPGTGGGNTDTALNGTWTGDDGDLTFNNGNFEMSGFMKGTYTTSGGSITVTVTHIHGDMMDGMLESKWYTKAELKAAVGDYLDDDEIDEMFSPATGTYSISGNTLTMTMDGDTMTFTKGGGSTNPGTDPGTNPGGTAITYTASPNSTSNTTAINFTFSAAVSGLAATDITVTNGTGSVSKGTLSGSGTSWSLGITVNTAGNVTVSINKSGIESATKTVAVAKQAASSDITYTAASNSTSNTTAITLTFSSAVSGLLANDITVTNGTGSATKGTLSGSGTSWSLGITVTTAGNVTVSINKSGIESGSKTVAVAKPAGPAQWTAITQSVFTSSDDINAIAFGDGKFIAVGKSGKMAASTDGATWTAVTQSVFTSSQAINAIAYGNGKFVASGGNDGKMAVSTDGATWTEVTQYDISSGINVIAYVNGKFFAGVRSDMAYSSDGTTWTKVPSSPLNNYDILAITYGNGTFVASGMGGKMASSSDGTTWTAVTQSIFTQEIKAIAYGNGTFVAGGKYGLATSTDGATWTAVTQNGGFGTNKDVAAIVYANNMFVAAGYMGTMATSTDGTTWTAVSNTTFPTGYNDSILAIAFGNNTFVAVGKSGKMAYLNN